jgi:hypothetical protein
MATRQPHRDLTLEEARTLLGVGSEAGPEEIRRAYHAAVRRWHPDLHAQSAADEQVAEERTKDLNRAYQLVMEESRRAPQEPEPRPPVCPLHAADQVYRCPRCGRPACVSCLIRDGCVVCARAPRRRTDASLTLLWVPILGALGLAFKMDWPASSLLWALWGYLALLGITVLARIGLRAIVLWVVFPVSLPIAGAWLLLTGVFAAEPSSAASGQRPRRRFR